MDGRNWVLQVYGAGWVYIQHSIWVGLGQVAVVLVLVLGSKENLAKYIIGEKK